MPGDLPDAAYVSREDVAVSVLIRRANALPVIMLSINALAIFSIGI
jgi:hypothetical protein